MENQFQTIVINLSGGPGSGKSTTAAGVFYELKKMGYVCELVTEFAKDKVWEDSTHILDNQIYIFGKQYHKMWRLNGKVQFIITDSCLPLSIYYSKLNSENFNNLVMECYDHFTNAMFFIDRGDGYERQGRIQTLEESKKIDESILDIFKKYNLVYERVHQSDAVSYIVNEIKKYFPIQ